MSTKGQLNAIFTAKKAFFLNYSSFLLLLEFISDNFNM